MLDGTCFQALDLVKYLFINVNKSSIVELVLHMYYKSQKLNFQRPNDPWNMTLIFNKYMYLQYGTWSALEVLTLYLIIKLKFLSKQLKSLEV